MTNSHYRFFSLRFFFSLVFLVIPSCMDSCGEYVRRERRLWYLLCFLNRAQSKRQVSEREKENNQRRRSSLGHEHIRV
jgi:hypothetical protein